MEQAFVFKLAITITSTHLYATDLQ